MQKALRRMHRKQRGFTLIELLIVIAILGTLAAVLSLTLPGMLGKGKVEAANTELNNVQTAVMAAMADAGATSVDTGADYQIGNNAGTQDYTFDTDAAAGVSIEEFIHNTIKGYYTLDGNGEITDGDPQSANGGWTGIKWDATNNKWKKS